jgi:pantothenate kinase
MNPFLVNAALSLVPETGRGMLGVAGVPGSGKTTLVEQLVAAVADSRGADFVAHVPMDGFHLSDAQLTRLGILDRKGAPDTFDGWGYTALLQRIRSESDHPVYVPGFERDLEQPIAAALVVPPTARLVVTEGNYLLLPDGPWPKVRGALDEVWFVLTDEQLRVERLVERHVLFGKDRDHAVDWVDRVDGANARLVTATADRADRIVLNRPEGWRFRT